jgi:hypothetical protein
MRRLSAAVVAALVAILATSVDPVAADTTGNATTDNGGIEHGVSIRLDIPPRRGVASDRTPPCDYNWMDYPSDATVTNVDGTDLVGDGTGQWFMLRCNDELVRVVYVRPGTPAEMADQAQRYMPIPAPLARFAPPEQQIVNLATWLWIDEQRWFPLRSTVAIPGVSVAVVAEPVAVDWTTGDGTVVVCEGPGTAFDPTASTPQVSDCTHTFARSSAAQPEGTYAASVTVRWHATWTVQGAVGGGDLGIVARTVQVRTRVGEVQAVNTNAN